MAGVQEQIAEVLAAATRCAASETTDNYDHLTQQLQDLAELAKDACECHGDYGKLVGKLRAGTALSAEEMATLRLLIVGDADYYLKYDEEYERCKTEITKILGEIERLKANDLGCEALMHLNVLCREAASMVVPTQHYLESRERVRRFEAATQGTLDAATAGELAGIVEGMLRR